MFTYIHTNVHIFELIHTYTHTYIHTLHIHIHYNIIEQRRGLNVTGKATKKDVSSAVKKAVNKVRLL